MLPKRPLNHKCTPGGAGGVVRVKLKAAQYAFKRRRPWGKFPIWTDVLRFILCFENILKALCPSVTARIISQERKI